MNYYLKMLKNTFNYRGIASRKEFWWPVLINVCVALIFALTLFISLDVFYILEFLLFLAVLLPMLSLCVRRLHDVDRGGYNLFWHLFPIVGTIIVTMYMTEKSKYNYKP